MLFGTWSQAHAYDPFDYMETRLKSKTTRKENSSQIKTGQKKTRLLYMSKRATANPKQRLHNLPRIDRWPKMMYWLVSMTSSKNKIKGYLQKICQ